MAKVEIDTIAAALNRAADAHRRCASADLSAAGEAARVVRDAVVAGRAILVFGNGGSATDAQHLAAELVGRFMRERRAVSATALTADSAILTSLGNDFGFEHVFARQIEAHGRPGDICFAFTTSGQSPNVLRALRTARDLGLRCIALTGRDGGEAGTLADVHVNVAEDSTARIQEVHRTLIHAICEVVEAAL